MGNQRDIAYQQIRDAITFGDLKPGERPIAEKICQEFGVGRTPLREALRQLQMENYVDLTPGRGASISKISIKDVEEIYDLVGLLEGFAAEIAAEKISASDKKKPKEPPKSSREIRS